MAGARDLFGLVLGWLAGGVEARIAPDSRTFHVLAEDRAFGAAAEVRAFDVAAEDRVFVAEAV